MNVTKKDCFYLSIIFLLVAAVFSNMLDNYFLRDETAMIRNIHDFRAVLDLFIGFRLIPALLFEAVYAVWGDNPRGYYTLNLGLHIVNVFLVYFCASLLLSKDRKTLNSAAGFLAALYFSVTFSHHETVYYIPGISDLISAMFCLLCFLYFMFYALSRATFHFSASVFFFVLFLLSKPTAVLFPFCLLAMARFMTVPLKAVAPFAAVLAVYAILPWVRAENSGFLHAYFQSGHVFSFFSVLLFYMLDFPFSLLGFTSSALWFPFPHGYYEQFTNTFVLTVFQCLIFGMFLAVFLLFFFLRKRNVTRRIFTDRDEEALPETRLVFFLFVCMLAIFLPHAFLPELNQKNAVRLIQYRYLYLPACFFSMIVSLGALFFNSRLKAIHSRISYLVSCVFVLILAVNAYETFSFGKVFLDEFSHFARQSVMHVTSSLDTRGRAKTAIVLNSPMYLEAYYKTCISDMVSVSSQEKIQMRWVRQKKELEMVLTESKEKNWDVHYFIVDDSGFREINLNP